MQFRTEFKVEKSKSNFHYNDQIFCIGSCFAEHIFDKLIHAGFHAFKSPFGIVFNPLLIVEQLNSIVENKFDSRNLFESQNMFFSWQHHSKITALSKDEMLKKITMDLYAAQSNILSASKVIITLGSSNYYFHNIEKINVANCHKMPSVVFEKKDASITEIVVAFHPLIQLLLERNSEMKIIFTVSPVRYLRDGFVANSRSKSKLQLAIAELEQQYESISYFPSYELFMDDLRDYRYVKEDLVHPNEFAIEYIWQKFCEYYFTSETLSIKEKILEIRAMQQHKPIHPNSIENTQFQEKIKKKIVDLQSLYPFLQL